MAEKKKSLLFPSPSGLCIRLAIVGLLVGIAPFLAHLHWTIDLASHFQLQAAFCLLILLLVTLIMKKWKPSLVITLIFALTLYNLLPTVINEHHPVRDPSSQTLKVTTINVLTSNEEKEKVTDYLSKTTSELIVLCETNQAWTQHLIRELGEAYPYRFSDPKEDNFGLLILSKYPISKGKKHTHSDYDIKLLEVTIDSPIGFLRVFGAHPVPPVGGEASKARNDYLDAIAKRSKASPHPVLVAGDLNATRWSSSYTHLLEEGKLIDLSDGMGFHTTWKPYKFSLFGLPIDHLLTSPSIMALSYEIGTDVGSDHRPVTAVLTLAK